MDEKQDLRHLLKRLTAEAYERQVAPSRAAETPGLGDLYHLEACPEPGVEWLVVEVESATGDHLVIPADSLSWIGSADVAALDEAAMGPLVLRTDLGLWLGRQVLTDDRRGGTIAVRDLERVRTHLQQRPAAASTAAEETDHEAEYRDWRRSLEGARNALARVYGGRIEEVRSEIVEQPSRVEPLQVEESPIDEEALASDDEKEPSLPAETKGAKIVSIRRWREPRVLMTVAASGLAVLAAGALIGYLTEQRRSGSRLSSLQEAHAALVRQLEAERQPQIVPWALAPFGTTRGETRKLVIPAGVRSIGLLVDAANGDRVEIFDAAGDSLWSGVVERLPSRDEAFIVLPASLMPPGRYRIKIWHDDPVPVDFDLLIELSRQPE